MNPIRKHLALAVLAVATLGAVQGCIPVIVGGTGMAVAIPALIAHRYFRARVSGYVVEMEKEAAALMDALDGRPAVLAAAAAAGKPAEAKGAAPVQQPARS